MLAISSIKGSGVVWCWGILDFGTITGALPSMWGMFGVLWIGVMKTQEGTLDVTRHGEINSTLGIVPLEGKTTIPGGCPICSDLIMVLEGIEEVVGLHPGWCSKWKSH